MPVESIMKLRYFCDGCGKQVPRSSERCPYCGRFFTGIQCPRCGHRSEAKDFDSGCPSCGYLRLPESTLKKFSQIGRRSYGGSLPGSPLFYRILGTVLALILVAFLVLLFFRSAFS